MPKRTHYPNLMRQADRYGNERYYVRRRGLDGKRRKVRLEGNPGSPAFDAAYRAAMEDQPALAASKKPSRGDGGGLTLKALAAKYMASPEFAALAPTTRYTRRKLLDRICLSRIPGGSKRGDLPAPQMETRHVRAIRDENAARPHAANGRVKALRQLYAWGMEAADMPGNPARDIPYLKPLRPGGFHSWSREEVAQFAARHPPGSKAHMALSIMLYTGARRCDAVKMGRQMVRNGWLFFTEQKGSRQAPKHRAIPIVTELDRAIAAAAANGNTGALTYLQTAFGKPFTAAGFGNWFRDRCDEAGLPHCSAHGLRKAGATLAAEAGATEHQLMAIYGWDSPKQAALYTRAANRRRLAGDAMGLISAGLTLPSMAVGPANGPTEIPVGPFPENDNDHNDLTGRLAPRAGARK